MSLLSQQSQVNADTAFFAPASGGGGGGGGGGPNLSLSSIVMNGLSAGSGGSISWAYDFPFTSTGVPAGQVGLQQGNVKDSAGNATNAVMVAVNNGGSALASDFAAGRVIVGAQGTGNNAAAVPTISNNGGLLNIAPGLSVSSITCPTINGAVPGGGSVGPNLGLSTLTFGGGSNPGAFMENKTILLNQASAVPTIGSAALAWNNASSNITLVAPSTTYVYIATEKLVGNLQVKDDGVYASPFMSTANLQCSTVNGAVYPPAASGITQTTVATLASVSIPATSTNTNPVAITGQFNTTNGHLYQLVGTPYLQVSPNASATSAIQFELGNLDRAYTSAFPATPFRTDIAAFGNQPGLLLEWRSGGNYTTNVISVSMYDPLGNAVSSFTNASANLTLFDLGPVT